MLHEHIAQYISITTPHSAPSSTPYPPSWSQARWSSSDHPGGGLYIKKNPNWLEPIQPVFGCLKGLLTWQLVSYQTFLMEQEDTIALRSFRAWKWTCFSRHCEICLAKCHQMSHPKQANEFPQHQTFAVRQWVELFSNAYRETPWSFSPCAYFDHWFDPDRQRSWETVAGRVLLSCLRPALILADEHWWTNGYSPWIDSLDSWSHTFGCCKITKNFTFHQSWFMFNQSLGLAGTVLKIDCDPSCLGHFFPAWTSQEPKAWHQIGPCQ